MEFGPILRSMSRNKVRYGLIVLEIALTLAIVTNCVSLIRDAQAEIGKESGFDDEQHPLACAASPSRRRSRRPGTSTNSAPAGPRRAAARCPGVKAVSNTRFLPWQGGGSSTELRLAGGKGAVAADADLQRGRRARSRRSAPRSSKAAASRRDEAPSGVAADRGSPREASVRWARTARPKEKISQDVVISQAFARLAFGPTAPRSARGSRTATATSTTSSASSTGSTTRTAGRSTSTSMFFASTSANYAGRGGLPACGRSRAALDSVKASIEKALVAANGGRNVTRPRAARDQGPVPVGADARPPRPDGGHRPAPLRHVARDHRPHVVLGRRADAPDRDPPRARAPRRSTSCATSSSRTGS